MKLAIFAYNFPHKKTQDFIFRTLCEGYKIDCIIAADPIELNIPKSSIRVKLRNIDLVHPNIISKTFNIPYFIIPHNSDECSALLRQRNIDIGLIAGARILKKHIIDSVKIGIINFHPGYLPFVRGLDALQWAIYDDHPIGVTAHLINEKVDAGKVLIKEEIPLYKDDTLLDLSTRLYETQINMIRPAIEKTSFANLEDLEEIGNSKLYRKMNPEQESKIEELLRKRIARIFS